MDTAHAHADTHHHDIESDILDHDNNGGGGGVTPLFADTQFGETSTENILLLFLAAVIAYWLWSRSTDLVFRYLASLFMFGVFLAAISFQGDWAGYVILAPAFGLLSAWMIIKASIDGFNERKATNRQRDQDMLDL